MKYSTKEEFEKVNMLDKVEANINQKLKLTIKA